MSPEGLNLLKKAAIGLGLFLLLLFGYRGWQMISDKPDLTQIKMPSDEIALMTTSETPSQLFTGIEERANHSAKKGLTRKLHFHAYNAYRSNRLRNAIETWETVQYLSPEDPIIELRLKEAKTALNTLVQENITLGSIDYKYLRYNRAIHFWTRAANLVMDIDNERYAQIQSYINMAERHLKK